MLRNYIPSYDGLIKRLKGIIRKGQNAIKYYDQKMRCMKLKPDDLVIMQVKSITGDH